MHRGLSLRSQLPQLPMQVYPLVGSGIIERELKFSDPTTRSVEEAIAAFRAEHSAERLPHFRWYWYKPVHGDVSKAAVYYRWKLDGKKHSYVVGVTKNDLTAIRILIANQIAGAWMSGIRWEIYEDPECEEFVEMGRFDQWDLLEEVSLEKLRELAVEGISPRGRWDFDHMLWARNCCGCGAPIELNDFVFNIDSAICAKCGNRPFLAPSIHQHARLLSDPEFNKDTWLHLLDWMTSVGANFNQVRASLEDQGGEKLAVLWEKTLLHDAINPERSGRVQKLLESNTTIDFGMYQGACRQLSQALLGQEPFREEHRIAARFVVEATRLINVRQLSTSEA